MDNKNMLSQAIRFQRTALQNGLTIISTVQRHNDQFLRATLERSPWIPASGKKACLFWADILIKNISGMTDLADQSLADMEQYSYTSVAKPEQEKPQAPPRPPTTRKAAPVRKDAAAQPQTVKKSRTAAQPSAKQDTAVKKAVAKRPGADKADSTDAYVRKQAGPENPA